MSECDGPASVKPVQIFNLPHNVVVEVYDDPDPSKDASPGVITHPDLDGPMFDGMMSLVLALACQGFHLDAPAFLKAYETAVEAILNNDDN